MAYIYVYLNKLKEMISNKDRSNCIERRIADRCGHLVNNKLFFRKLKATAFCGGSGPTVESFLSLGGQEPHLTQRVAGPHRCTCMPNVNPQTVQVKSTNHVTDDRRQATDRLRRNR